MLVLKRRQKETIVLKVPTETGEIRIELKTFNISKGACSVAIDAPPEVQIVRGEIENTTT